MACVRRNGEWMEQEKSVGKFLTNGFREWDLTGKYGWTPAVLYYYYYYSGPPETPKTYVSCVFLCQGSRISQDGWPRAALSHLIKIIPLLLSSESSKMSYFLISYICSRNGHSQWRNKWRSFSIETQFWDDKLTNERWNRCPLIMSGWRRSWETFFCTRRRTNHLSIYYWCAAPTDARKRWN